MVDKSPLAVELRDAVGKGAARQSRREGFVPGVIYGGNAEPVAIKVKQSELLRRLKLGKFLSTLHKLDLDGKEERVVCRNVQRDIVKDLPTHVDFLRLRKGAKIALSIPVEFENQETCVGIKRGGNLVIVRSEVELVVPADNIPDHITIDIAESQIGDVLHISDVTLPDGVTPTITDRDFVIANISAPTILKDDDEEEGGAEEAAEGAEEAAEEEGGEGEE